MMSKDGQACSSAGATSVTPQALDTREITQALELAIAQIQMSLQESEGSIASLVSAITFMGGCVRRIEREVTAMRMSGTTSDGVNAVSMQCQQAQASLQQAIMASQFYDRLSQRFQHVQENLHAVVQVLRAPDQQHPALWKNLHDKVRSVYSLEQEQRLYQALLQGLARDGALTESSENEPVVSNSIELF